VTGPFKEDGSGRDGEQKYVTSTASCYYLISRLDLQDGLWSGLMFGGSTHLNTFKIPGERWKASGREGE
jgi:hypothetical protein